MLDHSSEVAKALRSRRCVIDFAAKRLKHWSRIRLIYMQALTAPFVVRYKAFADTVLVPKSLLKGLDALPNYNKWSKAIHGENSVTDDFDGPTIAKGMVEKVEKMKAEAK